MKVINHAKDIKKIEEITKYECDVLFEKWMQPDFLPNVMAYLESMKKDKKKKPQGPKL
jgi:hypothetical protein